MVVVSMSCFESVHSSSRSVGLLSEFGDVGWGELDIFQVSDAYEEEAVFATRSLKLILCCEVETVCATEDRLNK